MQTRGAVAWHRRYQYALDANRLSSTSASMAEPARPLYVDPAVGPRYTQTYDHDTHGNMTAMPGLGALRWDADDQLVEIDLGGGGRAYYTYDADGRRTRKTIRRQTGTEIVERIYLDGWERYRRHLAGGLDEEIETLHVGDQGSRLSLVETKTIEGGAPVASPSPRPRYQLNDHLGTCTIELDGTPQANVISYEELFPDGAIAYRATNAAVDVSPKRYRYTTKERDEETGFDYFGARYYASWLGRWISADPAGLVDGPNLYAFVKGSPVNARDATGLACDPNAQSCASLDDGALEATGVGLVLIPDPQWYYRAPAGPREILTGPMKDTGGKLPGDPTFAQISEGAPLLPRGVDPGGTFVPEKGPGEMTFRHLRAEGNVPRIGTDRISTAGNLEAFSNVLADRGTGELLRIDVAKLQEMGAEFLTTEEVMVELDKFERSIEAELAQAKAENRGGNFIKRLEGRLEGVQSARSRAAHFGEGQGVKEIPAAAITEVVGGNTAEAVGREMATLRAIRGVRIGGGLLLVYGAFKSGERIGSATPEEMPRVAAQEAGGWALSFPAGAAGAKAGVFVGGLFGIESGPGAILTGAVGGIIGGGIGFFAGQQAVDWMWSLFE